MAGRKLRWALGIGAAALVVGIGAVVLPRPGDVPPVPAAPQSPAATSAAPSPSPSASRRENWYRWQRIGDAPIDLNVHPEVAAEHGYYLLGANGSCELTTYFYESASDRWDKLPALGNAKGWCVAGSATEGDDLYLLLGLDSEDEVLAGELAARRAWRFGATTRRPGPGRNCPARSWVVWSGRGSTAGWWASAGCADRTTSWWEWGTPTSTTRPAPGSRTTSPIGLRRCCGQPTASGTRRCRSRAARWCSSWTGRTSWPADG